MPKKQSQSRQAAGSAAREQRLYDALKRITQYDSPERIRTLGDGPRGYMGLSADEALEMAYDNIQQEAKNAIHGMRRPKLPNISVLPQPGQ